MYMFLQRTPWNNLFLPMKLWFSLLLNRYIWVLNMNMRRWLNWTVHGNNFCNSHIWESILLYSFTIHYFVFLWPKTANVTKKQGQYKKSWVEIFTLKCKRSPMELVIQKLSTQTSMFISLWYFYSVFISIKLLCCITFIVLVMPLLLSSLVLYTCCDNNAKFPPMGLIKGYLIRQ